MGDTPSGDCLMAFFPCDYDGARYKGPSQHLYPARIDGVAAARAHLRLCPDHMAELLQALEPYLVSDEGETYQSRLSDVLCQGCNRPMEESEDSVFVTAYPRSQDRADYWFRMHRDCRLPPQLEPLKI